MKTKTVPSADAGFDKDILKARKIIEQRNLTGAANNTKWQILLDTMRNRQGWKPSYRYGYVNGFVSDWDVEWWHHVPIPFLGVEWFDISLYDHHNNNHSEWILHILNTAKFDYQLNQDTTIVRIFGYHPRNSKHLND